MMDVPLSPTQAAYVALVLSEHEKVVRNADVLRDQHMSVLLREVGIPEGVSVRWHRKVDGGPMVLQYEAPNAPAGPAALPEVGEKSTVREHEGA